MTDRVPIPLEEIRADVADILDLPVAEVGVDDNLLAEGLDSVRLMALSARWRSRGVGVPYVELAKEPTIRKWSELFSAPAG
ncbi:phosphopantetheine-binding protein [Streptomyces sp. I05A-00742]|uniref:phosphopantetheine-binding protein n=1 Tax=Streptomyces sp. I05A-00742 TaxID=2732853 RepID=UPI0020173E28|nr:phosphopantetheine-binding protein [Streptomyces sp. I05A-00742]